MRARRGGHEPGATGVRATQKRPLPFPPGPARYLGIEVTRRALAKADGREGRRGPWLRTLDRAGLGWRQLAAAQRAVIG